MTAAAVAGRSALAAGAGLRYRSAGRRARKEMGKAGRSGYATGRGPCRPRPAAGARPSEKR